MNELTGKEILTNAASLLGAKGGRSGKGDVKKRSKEHYEKLSMLGVAARKKKLNNS